jgi:hypothetical protein
MHYRSADLPEPRHRLPHRTERGGGSGHLERPALERVALGVDGDQRRAGEVRVRVGIPHGQAQFHKGSPDVSRETPAENS